MEKIELKLNKTEQEALREIALTTGKTEGELIGEINAHFRRLIRHKLRLHNDRSGMLRARGIWKDRDDLPDFGRLRREWDRL